MAPAMPPSSQTQARPIRRELSLAELHADIARCLWGAENGGTSQARKAFKRLVWLEEIREKLHGIPASRRIPVEIADHGQAHAIARTLAPVFASCTHLPLRAEVSPSSSTTGPARLGDAQPPPSRFHETRRRRMRRTWPPNQ